MTKVNLKMNKIDGPTVKRLITDSNLFSQFYKENKYFVQKIAMSLISRGDTRFEDICQVGDIALFRACKKFDTKRPGASSFSTFAWGVIWNDMSQELKKEHRKNHKDISIERFKTTRGFFEHSKTTEYYEKPFKDFEETRNSFEEDMIKKIDIDRKISMLSDTEKKIYKYRNIYKMTLREISEKLEINWHTFKVIYYSLRDKLKNENETRKYL